MKKIHSLIIIFLLTANLYSQDTIKVGDKAPKINITDYILNSPKDKNIENKYIILEFWATWCAPCLGAVPHLNDLRDQFKNRKDLVFLSLTYEKPEKTKRTLEKIAFKTIVVSDQTKKTETNYNVEGLPHTVLIDDKGIVKWIGKPYDLNSSLIEKFLKGENNLTESVAIEEEKNDQKEVEKIESENNTDVALKFLKDKNTQFIFSLINSQKNDYNMAMEALFIGKYVDLNNNLKSILSKIIKKPKSQIIIPENLVETKFNLIYKNSNKLDINTLTNNLKTNLLNSLNLKEYIETRSVEVYNLKIINTKKLNISPDQDEENHSGSNETHFIFSNSNIETLIKELGDYQKIIIFNETGLNENLDFIIRKCELEELLDDLETYGLTLEKVNKEIEFYNYK